ncbi:MAG TPA: hypothetical protein VD710_03755 [Nitrososphaeraceae archaeon]|nr:hypothetical protein [Nitrososphaeraceae archaeon]
MINGTKKNGSSVAVINAVSDINCFNHLDDGSKGATDMTHGAAGDWGTAHNDN